MAYLTRPKRGLVDGPGSYGGERAIPRKYIDGIEVSETLDGKKTYRAKVKVGDETKSFSDSSLEKVKKWKEKNSAIARKKGYGKRDMSFAAEQTKKQRAKETKKTAKARANIDKWTKNWLNKNLNKYGVRELDLFKKELVEDWAKELKKNPNLYVGKPDFKPTFFEARTMTMKDFPNLTGSSISNKPFKYGPRVLGDKATIETTLNKIFYDNKLKDKNFKNKVKNYMQHFIDGKPHGNNVVARNAYDAKTAKLLDDDVLYLLSAADSKLMGSAKQAVLVNALGNVYTDYRKVTNKMGASYLKNSQLIDEFLGGTNLIAKASVREHNALKKIFDVSELPLTLRYNIDHMYGISEAAREITNPNPSKARVRAILNNTMGMTQKRNFMLGTEGYSFRRKSLINKINAGKNVDANLLKLNEATKVAYNVDNAYKIKQGKATPSKSFVGQTRKERFQSYFEEIYQTPEGKKQIIKQAGSLENLIAALGCPDKIGRAMGGRIGFQQGTIPSTKCVQAGAKIVNEGRFDKLSSGQKSNLTQILNRGAKLGRNILKFGIIPEAIFVAGESLYRMGMGQRLDVSLLKAVDYLLPGNQGKLADKIQLESTLGKENADIVIKANEYKEAQQQLATAKSNLETNQAVLDGSDLGYTGNINALEQQQLDEQIIKLKEQNVKDKYQSEAVRDQAAMLAAESEDRVSANSPILKAIQNAKNAETDDFETLFTPEKKQEGPAEPLISLDQFAEGTFSDADLKRRQEEMGAPELTKRNLFNFYRGNEGFNKQVFREIFKDARSSLAKREQLFGASGDFFKGEIKGGVNIPTNRFEDFKLGMYAGGGIAKLAGVDSGPPPEKGPTPQGLDFLLNRGRR